MNLLRVARAPEILKFGIVAAFSKPQGAGGGPTPIRKLIE
jgi:hypothetical protein